MLPRLRAAIVILLMICAYIAVGGGLVWGSVSLTLLATLDRSTALAHWASLLCTGIVVAGFLTYFTQQWRRLTHLGSDWINLLWPNAEPAAHREELRSQVALQTLRKIDPERHTVLWVLNEDRSVNSFALHLPKENKTAILLTLGAINHLTEDELKVMMQHGRLHARHPSARWHTRVAWITWIIQLPLLRGLRSLRKRACRLQFSARQFCSYIFHLLYNLLRISLGSSALLIRHAGSWAITGNWQQQLDAATVHQLGSQGTFLRVLSQAYEHNQEFPSAHLNPWAYMTFALIPSWHAGATRTAMKTRSNQIKAIRHSDKPAA